MKDILNRKEIMRLAVANLRNVKLDPYEAILLSIEVWLNKKGFMLVPILPEGNRQDRATPKGEA